MTNSNREQQQQSQKEKTAELAELRQLKERLAINAEWQRSILETAGDAIISFDHEGTILTCNNAAAQMFGYPVEELPGRDATILLPEPDDTGHHLFLNRYFNNSLESGPNSKRDGFGRRRNGSTFPFDCVVSKMSFEGEDIFTAIIRDTSREKALEADRRQAHDEIRQILDTAADGIRIINEDFIVVQANQTFCTLAGTTWDMVVGQKCYKSFPGAACDTAECPVRQIFSGVHHIDCEVDKVRMDGSTVPCLLSVNPFIGTNGELKGIIEDFRDISEIKKTERALLEAGEKAAIASHAKSLFIANMSHELRTPLNSIQGMTYLLERNSLTPEQKKHILQLSQATQSLLAIVDTILDFSSLDREEMTLTHEEFNLENLVEDLESRFSEQCRQKGLVFTASLAKDLPLSLIGDPRRLQQLLSLLIDNGIKFTNRGDIDLIITLDKENEEEILLSFSVKDTGVGMTPEEQVLALEPFTQLDGSSTRFQGGIGLGLSLATKLLFLMNSELLIDSQPGQGSVFSFSLSFRRGAGTEERSKTRLVLQETREEPCDLAEPVKAEQESNQAISLFRELASLLRAADIQSKQVVKVLVACPHTPEIEEKLLLLEKAVTGYDFEQAENILAAIAGKSGFSL